MENERKIMQKDPFIEKWIKNFNKNVENGTFSDERVKPFSFLINTKPYYNVPFVLVAAGPSLDKNIQILKNYQKKAIILTADVCLFKLLENDIKPDFVVSIDPANDFARFWKGLDTSQFSLICPVTAHPDIINEWKGKIFFFVQDDFKHSIEKYAALKKISKSIGNFGTIQNRFFVGATMLQVASNFNPSPAILIGYDFAYTGNKAYCDGFLERKIYDDTHEYGTPEHSAKIEELKKMEVRDIIPEQDIYDNITNSTRLYIFYRNSFSQLVQKLNINVINSTEGGILKKIKILPLLDSLNDYCKNEIKKIDTFVLPKRNKRRKK
jgi:hypothetical protein